MAEGANSSNTDRWLDMSNPYVWSITWFVTEFWLQGGSISCLSTSYNESHNAFQRLRWYITTYCVGRQPKQYHPQYFLTFSDSHHAVPLPWSLGGLLNQQNMVWEAGSRAQSWLVTCRSSDSTLSIWAPSSRLAFKRRVLMGRPPKESYGICKEILPNERCKETHKHKYYTQINVLTICLIIPL